LGEDPVGDTLSYLCEPLPWVKQIVAITHNVKFFDLEFILNRAIFLKRRPELIMKGIKVLYMIADRTKFIVMSSFLQFQQLKLAGVFGLSASKFCYTHYLNKKENLNNVDRIPDVSYYCVNKMNNAEITEFLD